MNLMTKGIPLKWNLAFWIVPSLLKLAPPSVDKGFCSQKQMESLYFSQVCFWHANKKYAFKCQILFLFSQKSQYAQSGFNVQVNSKHSLCG